MSIIGIHQPNFIPSLGYFIKMNLANQFVLYDTAQYSKNSFINRNRLSGSDHLRWITIPVLHSGKSKCPIRDMEIDPLHFKPNKIIQTVNQFSSQTDFSKQILERFSEHLHEADNHRKLAILNERLIRWISSLLEIQTPIVRASELILPDQAGTEALIHICLSLNGRVYISGKSGKKYLEEGLFQAAGLELRYPDYYEHLGDLHRISILQLLLNQRLEEIKTLVKTISSTKVSIENESSRK